MSRTKEFSRSLVQVADTEDLFYVPGQVSRRARVYQFRMHTPPKDWPAAELIERCSTRPIDEVAWSEFVSRFDQTIRLTIGKIYHQKAREDSDRKEQFSGDGIDDLVQSVYYRLVCDDSQALIRFQNVHLNSIYSYLATISANVVRDHFREERAQKRPRLFISLDEFDSEDSTGLAMTGSAPDSGLYRGLTMQDLDRALIKAAGKRHHDRDILIFKLHYLDGMTLEEIASILEKDITRVGVNSTLNRMIKKLRQILEDPSDK